QFEDHVGAARGRLEDLHVPGQHGVEQIRFVALAEQRCAFVERTHGADRRDALPIVGPQAAKQHALAKQLSNVAGHTTWIIPSVQRFPTGTRRSSCAYTHSEGLCASSKARRICGPSLPRESSSRWFTKANHSGSPSRSSSLWRRNSTNPSMVFVRSF